jgi:hypothetical protein
MDTCAKLATAVMTALALTIGGGTAFLRAQAPQPGQPPSASPLDQPGVTPAEIQRMFEAVALVRAQEALKLSDDRYLPFLAKYKALQDVRRRMQQERMRLLRELNRAATDPTADEAHIKDRLKALQDLDARSEAELHKAYEGVDQVLDVRQQAKFRMFEENMERQKIELLIRARQGNRQQNKRPS